MAKEIKKVNTMIKIVNNLSSKTPLVNGIFYKIKVICTELNKPAPNKEYNMIGVYNNGEFYRYHKYPPVPGFEEDENSIALYTDQEKDPDDNLGMELIKVVPESMEQNVIEIDVEEMI